MTTLTDTQAITAQAVTVTDDALIVELADGRTLSVPLVWYPRLLHGMPAERNNWRFIGDGIGIHWLDLDEDISIEGLILGKPSGESLASFKRWLEGRERRQPKSKGRARPNGGAKKGKRG
jgi:hypothetical protein